MKPFAFLSWVLLVTCSGLSIANGLPNLAPSNNDCGNGIYCAAGQTCMSNATGAGLIYACSPIDRAVRCMDARFSCPPSFICSKTGRCVSNTAAASMSTDTDATDATDVIVNVDAFRVADSRDFGKGMIPTSLSICGAVTRNFRLPNFCTCRDGGGGSEIMCAIGLQTYITIGASAWFRPCAVPSNFGYRAWASLLGVRLNVGNTWTTTFSVNRPIPGASFEIGRSNVGARVELSGDISRFIITSRLGIGVCAEIGVGPFSAEICNPSMMNWLPVVVLNGPRFDFSRLC
jgi:hypothetical protein